MNNRPLKQPKSSTLSKVLIVLWLLVIVVFIILVKEVQLDEIFSGWEAISSNSDRQETTEIPKVEISESPAVVEIGKIIAKTQASDTSPSEPVSSTPESPQTGNSPADQYKLAIANRKPTLVFFHSNTCKSCLQMIDTVNAVYPEFSNQVVLIDVDVYDPQNEDLIYRVGINYIPTLVFYSQSGDSLFSIGVISNEDLHQKLSNLSLGNLP